MIASSRRFGVLLGVGGRPTALLRAMRLAMITLTLRVVSSGFHDLQRSESPGGAEGGSEVRRRDCLPSRDALGAHGQAEWSIDYVRVMSGSCRSTGLRRQKAPRGPTSSRNHQAPLWLSARPDPDGIGELSRGRWS